MDAGQVSPGPERWRVTYLHRHETLKVGDIVIMTETPRRAGMVNLLFRPSDSTLHLLQDEHDQYVHVEPA